MKRILIAGAGFAGMHAALSAARLRDEQGVSLDALEIVVVAPEPRLVIRPRLYERAPETMVAPLAELFDAVDVRYEQGRVDVIDSASKSAVIVGPDGMHRPLPYDRLVLAAGSQGFKPAVPGLDKYSFSVDQLDDAIALDRHLAALGNRPPSDARDTVVVAGGGFTGIEVATEMPSRLRAILGPKAHVRVIIVDRNEAIAPAMGPAPRPLIEKALREAGVATRLGMGVSALNDSSVTLSDGQSIETATVIWAAGMRGIPSPRKSMLNGILPAGWWSTAICASPRCRPSSPPATPRTRRRTTWATERSCRASMPTGSAPPPGSTRRQIYSACRWSHTDRRTTSPASISARQTPCSPEAGIARSS